MKSQLSEKLDAIIARNPILTTYTRTGTKERLRRFPVRGFYEAFRRRAETFLVERGVFPSFSKMRTFWGDTIFYKTLAGWQLKKYGVLEGDELFLTRFIVDSLKPGDTFIDGGANVGWYTLLAANLVGERGLVHSFEPTTRTFEHLQRNVADRKNVTLAQKALANAVGRRSFHDFGEEHDVANTFSNAETIPHGDMLFTFNRDVEVETTTIDAYCSERNLIPNFIKLDIEGGEYEALQGAKRTLEKYRPGVTIEVWSGRGFLRHIIDYMRPFAYSVFDITKRGIEPLSFNIDAFDRYGGESSFDQKNIAFIKS